MLFVGTDGDEINVELRGKARETARWVAQGDMVAATLGTDSLLQLPKPGFGIRARIAHTPFGEKRVEAVHKHDVGLGSEPLCRPRGGLDAGRGEIDADQDARKLHEDAPVRAS